MHVWLSRETPPTRFDALVRFIDNPQLVAVILEIMRPSSKAGRNFQDRARWKAIADARENCATPLRSRTTPRLRPFLARLSPVVLHGMARTINDVFVLNTFGIVPNVLPKLYGEQLRVATFSLAFAKDSPLKPSACVQPCW